jgi:hypothetical protein
MHPSSPCIFNIVLLSLEGRFDTFNTHAVKCEASIMVSKDSVIAIK